MLQCVGHKDDIYMYSSWNIKTDKVRRTSISISSQWYSKYSYQCRKCARVVVPENFKFQRRRLSVYHCKTVSLLMETTSLNAALFLSWRAKLVKTYSVFWPSYILPSVLHQNWRNSHAVTLTGAISPLGVQINFERKQNAFFHCSFFFFSGVPQDGVLPCRRYVARSCGHWRFSRQSGSRCWLTVHQYQSPRPAGMKASTRSPPMTGRSQRGLNDPMLILFRVRTCHMLKEAESSLSDKVW